MKKYLMYGGMFVASFLVINVAMYFFLDMTQPKPIAEVSPDSLLHSESDSLLADEVSDTLATLTEPEVSLEVQSSPEPELLATTEADTGEDAHGEEPREPEPVEEAPEVDSGTPEQVSSDPEPPPENEFAVAEDAAEDLADAEIALEEIMQGDEKQLKKLAKLLEGMKPSEAAAIASRLATADVVTLVMRMKDRKAAKMLAAMPVDKATRVAMRMSELVAVRSTGS